MDANGYTVLKQKSDSVSGRRVALITGGARRLGAAIVRSLAGHGYDIVVHHGHSPREADELAAHLVSHYGICVETVQEDLRDVAAPARIVAAAITHLGALDVVVSSASIMKSVPLETVTPEHWVDTEAVNLRAPFFLMQAAAPRMRDGGVIIQMSDHLAFEAIYPGLIPHQVTKAGVTTLVRTMASALAPRLRVNAVAPGLVMPPEDMSESALQNFLRDVPLGHGGSADDVVEAIHFLIEARYVTGQVLHVDGGRHLWR